jgi:hypothetical protein
LRRKNETLARTNRNGQTGDLTVLSPRPQDFAPERFRRSKTCPLEMIFETGVFLLIPPLSRGPIPRLGHKSAGKLKRVRRWQITVIPSSESDFLVETSRGPDGYQLLQSVTATSGRLSGSTVRRKWSTIVDTTNCQTIVAEEFGFVTSIPSKCPHVFVWRRRVSIDLAH